MSDQAQPIARESRSEAVATPLASIFGSGFLVIVPVLAQAVGAYMLYAITAVTLVAYFVGCIIRHNIQYAEPVLREGSNKLAMLFERSSDVAIIIAYVISVTLYLHILASFVLGAFNNDSTVLNDIITSGIIIFIITVGVIKGLTVLSFLEKWALYITLGLILLVLAGFAIYDVQALNSHTGLVMPKTDLSDPWKALTIIAGTLIVVQGFETSRYLGNQFSVETRVWSSRWSQIISMVIYIAFVMLAMPVVHELNNKLDDNSLIKLVGFSVIVGLPIAVVIAAVLSQFSAAVADTFAASGNMKEVSSSKIKDKVGYLIIGVAALILTWSADTYQILALASRAFAFYYFLQCLVAFCVTKRPLVKVGALVMALAMAFIVIFAVPVS